MYGSLRPNGTALSAKIKPIPPSGAVTRKEPQKVAKKPPLSAGTVKATVEAGIEKLKRL